MADKTPAEKLEALVAAFETANKTATDNPGKVLRDLIATSPALKQQLEDAVSKGELTEFKGLPPGTNAGGQYSGTTMEIPVSKLNKAATDKAAANEVVFVLGHETRHGLNNPAEKIAGDGISVEVLDLRTIVPMDKEAIAASVAKTNKILIVHEDNKTGGVGAEISATIAEDHFEELDGPILRVAAADTHIPYAPTLEGAVIPNVDDVLAALRRLAAY